MLNKSKFNKRFNNYLCPLCMSDLKVVNNKYECTGEQLQLWKQEVDNFLTFNEEQKKEYLEGIEDTDTFLSWAEKDTIECEFSTVLDSYSDKYSMIPDPMIVGRIERSIGRELVEHELEPEFIFFRNGNKFSIEEFEDSYEYSVPRYDFEDL